MSSLMDQQVKNPSPSAGDIRDAGLIPGSGRSFGGGNGNPLQYSCLKNPMDRDAWWVTVPGVTKSWTRLSTPVCERACVCARTHTHTRTHP